MSVVMVRGKRALVLFDFKKCIHARHCVLGRPDVFVPNVEGDWIQPDNATPEEIAELAHACPSGAIQYERFDGAPNERPPRVNVVRVRENGPLAFHADLYIDGHGPALRATLCRCGASKRKPFCDGSHVEVGFVSSGEPPTQQSQPLAVRDGPLKVTPQPNASLKVEGSLEVCSGTGRTLRRVTKAFLCRCGQSAQKPFCDGTHARVGFVG